MYSSPKFWQEQRLKSVPEFASYGPRAYRTKRIGGDRNDGPELVAPAVDLFTA